jgi:CSLREA domain-containing protein
MIRFSKEEIAQSSKKALASAIVLAAMSAGMMMTAHPAHATDFTVNSTDDVNDHSCNVTHCSLREAMERADLNPGPDAIKFNIPGGGVKTIKPKAPLDTMLDDGTTIDGYSQPGSVVNTSAVGTNAQPLIELDGSEAGSPSVPGLLIYGDNVTVKGLVINRFSGSGIIVEDTFGSEHDGVGVQVQGNFIGTDASGTQDLGNGFDGVVVSGAFADTVGGPQLKDRNLFSGNGRDGVVVENSAHIIQGNVIGLKKDGTSALGNSGNGVSVEDSNDNFGNSIRQNAISSNGALGIDLGRDGPTANDGAGDADDGANKLQNKPVIGRATTGGSGTTIKGSLNSTPGKTFTVEFFSNPSTDSGEGRTFLGEKSVTTDASGKATFAFKPQAKVPRGQFVTATATSSVGNTSEFSAAKKLVRPR